MTDNATMTISYGQTPDGTLTLVVDGRGVHPEECFNFSAQAIATLMYESARHGAQSADDLPDTEEPT